MCWAGKTHLGWAPELAHTPPLPCKESTRQKKGYKKNKPETEYIPARVLSLDGVLLPPFRRGYDEHLAPYLGVSYMYIFVYVKTCIQYIIFCQHLHAWIGSPANGDVAYHTYENLHTFSHSCLSSLIDHLPKVFFVVTMSLCRWKFFLGFFFPLCILRHALWLPLMEVQYTYSIAELHTIFLLLMLCVHCRIIAI